MSTALIHELEAVLEVANDYGFNVGTPTAHALLFQIAYKGGDKPSVRGREHLDAREMFRSQDELGRIMGINAKSVGRVCLNLERIGIRVRRDGRTAAPYKAMIYRLPTVEEFAYAFGFRGEQVREFAAAVQDIVDSRSSKGGGITVR